MWQPEQSLGGRAGESLWDVVMDGWMLLCDGRAGLAVISTTEHESLAYGGGFMESTHV